MFVLTETECRNSSSAYLAWVNEVIFWCNHPIYGTTTFDFIPKVGEFRFFCIGTIEGFHRHEGPQRTRKDELHKNDEHIQEVSFHRIKDPIRMAVQWDHCSDAVAKGYELDEE